MSCSACGFGRRRNCNSCGRRNNVDLPRPPGAAEAPPISPDALAELRAAAMNPAIADNPSGLTLERLNQLRRELEAMGVLPNALLRPEPPLTAAEVRARHAGEAHDREMVRLAQERAAQRAIEHTRQTNVDPRQADFDIPHRRPTPQSRRVLRIAEDCPLCGNALVLRTNRDEDRLFVGCAGWPRCKFTEPYAERNRRETERMAELAAEVGLRNQRIAELEATLERWARDGAPFERESQRLRRTPERPPSHKSPKLSERARVIRRLAEELSS